ncbi:MAG: PmbA/TldA family metallopeptidase [Candidatus Heimdallarchaeota archaeon]
MKDGIDIADFAVEYGTKEGAKYIEARFIDSRQEGYATRNGSIIGGGVIYSEGIGIRVLTKEGIGFCSTAKLDKNNIKKAIDIALKMARASKRKTPIIFSEEEVVETKWETDVKQHIEDISDEEKIAFITGIDKTLVKQDFGESLAMRTLLMEMTRNKKYITNSEGSKVESDKSLIAFYTFNTAKGPLGSEQRFSGLASSKGWEWFKEDNIIDQIIQDNSALVKTAQHAKEMKLGITDV